jgi:hypothetical protein
MKDYPQYYIMGKRPVKLVLDDKGGVGALGFNWSTGEFELDWNAYLRLVEPGSSDAEKVSESEFEKYVEELRTELGNK